MQKSQVEDLKIGNRVWIIDYQQYGTVVGLHFNSGRIFAYVKYFINNDFLGDEGSGEEKIDQFELDKIELVNINSLKI